MINKKVILTVDASNTYASLDNEINVFRGDGNINLEIELVQKVFQFGRPMTRAMVFSDSITSASVDVVKPLGNEYFVLEAVELVDNVFNIKLDKTWIDGVSELGEYKLQINLLDNEGNKASLPYFSINVLPTLVDSIPTAKVGGKLNETSAVKSDENYVPATSSYDLAYWQEGEVISVERMNNQIDVIKASEAKIDTAISTANDTLTQTKKIQSEMIENNKQMVQESTARVDEAINSCAEVYRTTLRYRIVE